MTAPAFHLVGLTDAPIPLLVEQLRGDRLLLLQNPSAVTLVVKARRHQRSRLAADGQGVGGWQVVRSLRSYSFNKPCIYDGTVYASLQHALFACLLYITGGATGDLECTFSNAGRSLGRSAPVIPASQPS